MSEIKSLVKHILMIKTHYLLIEPIYVLSQKIKFLREDFCSMEY